MSSLLNPAYKEKMAPRLQPLLHDSMGNLLPQNSPLYYWYRQNIPGQMQDAQTTYFGGPSTSSRNEGNIFEFSNRPRLISHCPRCLHPMEVEDENYAYPTIFPLGQNTRHLCDSRMFHDYSGALPRVERPKRTGLCGKFPLPDSGTIFPMNDNRNDRQDPLNKYQKDEQFTLGSSLSEIRHPIPPSKTFEKSTDAEFIDLTVMPCKKQMIKFESNVNDYKPEELKVRVINDIIVVEGKQEVIIDGKVMSSKEFLHKYSIPENMDKEKICSFISSDGMLVISAPCIVRNNEDAKEIPIIFGVKKCRMGKQVMKLNEDEQVLKMPESLDPSAGTLAGTSAGTSAETRHTKASPRGSLPAIVVESDSEIEDDN